MPAPVRADSHTSVRGGAPDACATFTRRGDAQDKKLHFDLGTQLRGGWTATAAFYVETFGYDRTFYGNRRVVLPTTGDTVPFVGRSDLTNHDYVLSLNTPQWSHLSASAFYLFGYTMLLKRRTTQNIVWGGLAGCFPALIGWTAVTGELSWVPVVLFAVVFFWTPPHTWALAMRYREDYAAAGVPMLPVVATPRAVAVRIVAYSWAMVGTSLLLLLDSSGLFYRVSAVVLGGLFLREAHLLQTRVRRGDDVSPMRLFHWSITYLALLFVAVAVDQLL